jgi:hypothetical protein
MCWCGEAAMLGLGEHARFEHRDILTLSPASLGRFDLVECIGRRPVARGCEPPSELVRARRRRPASHGGPARGACCLAVRSAARRWALWRCAPAHRARNLLWIGAVRPGGMYIMVYNRIGREVCPRIFLYCINMSVCVSLSVCVC